MLEIHEIKFPDKALLVLTGPFVHNSTAGIEPFIMGAQELGYKHIILDFSGVTRIDSVGLCQLFIWYHKTQPHQIRLSIVNPLPRIQSVLELSHISDLVPIESPDSEMADKGILM